MLYARESGRGYEEECFMKWQDFNIKQKEVAVKKNMKSILDKFNLQLCERDAVEFTYNFLASELFNFDQDFKVTDL